MTPRKQLFHHDPANGIYGDCARTAYAVLMDMEPEDVPHFGELYYGQHALWEEATRKFLASKGYGRILIPYDCDLADVHRGMRIQNPGVYYLLSGASGAYDADHVVVCLDGEVVCDTSGSGVTGPGSDGYIWVEILVPLAMCVDTPAVAEKINSLRNQDDKNRC